MCMNSATMFGTETVRVRPVNCYGPHEAYSPYKGFIPDNFIPGEVYNVGSKQEWEMTIEEYSDLVLEAVGIDDSLVTYTPAEAFTTKVKTIDFSKAIRDLKHDPKVDPKEGIKRTVEWMRWYYRIED